MTLERISRCVAGATLTILAVASSGCAGESEVTARESLMPVTKHYTVSGPGPEANAKPAAQTRATAVHAEAGLPRYIGLALEQNPELRASFERWHASVLTIPKARRLPEPTLSFGYFVRPIETRVGPQRAKLSLQQTFPWPTRLTAGADAATAQARAMQQRFEAQTLAVTQRVATAYWNLWQLRVTRAIRRAHLSLVLGLLETVRARLATGVATLADLQQLDLSAARVDDGIRGMDEAERGLQAQLRAAIGVPTDFPVPTPEQPPAALMPTASAETLASLAKAHPMIDSLNFLAEAAEATAQAESADRLPSFALGADWIVTGEAAMPGVKDSGRDAVMVGAGVRLPLWQGSYSDSTAAAKASARAQRAERQALMDRAQAEVTSTLASLRDAKRRVDLYQAALVPQAEAAYESALGAYTVGRTSVAQALLAQRDLLELRIEQQQARADHARTWTKLEALVGQKLAAAAQRSPADSANDGALRKDADVQP